MPEHDGTQDRRLVVVKVSQPLFLQFVTTGWESRGKLRCVAGIPPDAVLVNTFIDPQMGDAGYVFYHPLFDPVPEGKFFPTLGIVMRTVEEEEATMNIGPLGSVTTPLSMALRFHEVYEELAPSFGYETRTETRQFDPESANGRLMTAVCEVIIRDIHAGAWVAPVAEDAPE